MNPILPPELIREILLHTFSGYSLQASPRAQRYRALLPISLLSGSIGAIANEMLWTSVSITDNASAIAFRPSQNENEYENGSISSVSSLLLYGSGGGGDSSGTKGAEVTRILKMKGLKLRVLKLVYLGEVDDSILSLPSLGGSYWLNSASLGLILAAGLEKLELLTSLRATTKLFDVPTGLKSLSLSTWSIPAPLIDQLFSASKNLENLSVSLSSSTENVMNFVHGMSLLSSTLRTLELTNLQPLVEEIYPILSTYSLKNLTLTRVDELIHILLSLDNSSLEHLSVRCSGRDLTWSVMEDLASCLELVSIKGLKSWSWNVRREEFHKLGGLEFLELCEKRKIELRFKE